MSLASSLRKSSRFSELGILLCKTFLRPLCNSAQQRIHVPLTIMYSVVLGCAVQKSAVDFMNQTLQTKLVKAQISNTAPTAARCKWRAWLHSAEPSNCWDELSVFVSRNMPQFAAFCCYPSNLWTTLVRSIQPWWVDAFERELCQACAKRDGYYDFHIFSPHNAFVMPSAKSGQHSAKELPFAIRCDSSLK